MNRLAIAGLVFLPAAIPLVQRGISDYSAYLGGKAQYERNALACANTVCTGFVDYGEIGQHLDSSMRYLLSGLVTGSVGTVFVGLNWRELVDEAAYDEFSACGKKT